MDSTKRIGCIYNRTAKIYDLMDRMIKEESRTKVLDMAKGKVREVEVGCCCFDVSLKKLR